MACKQNLRFLLALGGQRVVIIKNQNRLQLYAGQQSDKPNVSPERLCAVVQTK